MMKNTIIILGSDRYFLEEALSRGFKVVVVREYSKSGIDVDSQSDYLMDISVGDYCNLEEVLIGLKNHNIQFENICAVHTNFEFALATASALAMLWNLPSTSLEVVSIMRSKYLQKRMLEKHSIPVPKSHLLEHGDVCDDDSIMYPAIIKPNAGAGTELTFLVKSPHEAHAALNKIRNENFTGELVIEEYVEGVEHCADGWITNGKIAYLSVAKYSENCLDLVSNNNEMRMYRYPTNVNPNLTNEVINFAENALNNLGYLDGLFHLEFFLTNEDKIIFSECAARRGGASIEEEVRLHSGISLAVASLDIALGMQPSASTREYLKYVGTVHPKLPSGIVIDLPHLDKVTQFPGVKYGRILTSIGGKTKGITASTSDRDAVFLVEADSREELDRNMDIVRNYFVDNSIIVNPRKGKAARNLVHKTLNREDLMDMMFPLPR